MPQLAVFQHHAVHIGLQLDRAILKPQGQLRPGWDSIEPPHPRHRHVHHDVGRKAQCRDHGMATHAGSPFGGTLDRSNTL